MCKSTRVTTHHQGCPHTTEVVRRIETCFDANCRASPNHEYLPADHDCAATCRPLQYISDETVMHPYTCYPCMDAWMADLEAGRI